MDVMTVHSYGRIRMPKYKIHWTEELWYKDIVEAPSAEAAAKMVASSDYEWPAAYEFELQDSIEVEEVDG